MERAIAFLDSKDSDKRARLVEELLDTPARIYYKYEGTSPVGSHKLNTALAQAAIYLATAPKSNAVYTAYLAAARDASETEVRDFYRYLADWEQQHLDALFARGRHK